MKLETWMLAGVLFGLYVLWQRQNEQERRLIAPPQEIAPGQYSTDNPQYG